MYFIAIRKGSNTFVVHLLDFVLVQSCNDSNMLVARICNCNHGWYIYVTRSRKRGPFPQKSVCELDLSADSAKSIVHARENRLTLARSVPKLQSFEYHTRAYLGFEISAFISVL